MSKSLAGDFRKFMNKNYLGSWDVPDQEDLIATISHVDQEQVTNAKGTEVKLTLHFRENLKPMILNSTNAQAISKVAGSTKVERWAGQRIAIYTATVSAFGATVEALRVRDYTPKSEEIICTNCGATITASGKFSARAIAERAKTKYGTYLCMDCAKDRSAAEASEAESDQPAGVQGEEAAE